VDRGANGGVSGGIISPSPYQYLTVRMLERKDNVMWTQEAPRRVAVPSFRPAQTWGRVDKSNTTGYLQPISHTYEDRPFFCGRSWLNIKLFFQAVNQNGLNQERKAEEKDNPLDDVFFTLRHGRLAFRFWCHGSQPLLLRTSQGSEP